MCMRHCIWTIRDRVELCNLEFFWQKLPLIAKEIKFCRKLHVDHKFMQTIVCIAAETFFALSKKPFVGVFKV
jgi:hypothetical protein